MCARRYQIIQDQLSLLDTLGFRIEAFVVPHVCLPILSHAVCQRCIHSQRHGNTVQDNQGFSQNPRKDNPELLTAPKVSCCPNDTLL